MVDAGPSYAPLADMPLGPKWDKDRDDGELVDDQGRHGETRSNHVESTKTECFAFSSVVTRCLQNMGGSSWFSPTKILWAWESLVGALIRAGFVAEASWPIQTENATAAEHDHPLRWRHRFGLYAENENRLQSPVGIAMFLMR